MDVNIVPRVSPLPRRETLGPRLEGFHFQYKTCGPYFFIIPSRWKSAIEKTMCTVKVGAQNLKLYHFCSVRYVKKSGLGRVARAARIFLV